MNVQTTVIAHDLHDRDFHAWLKRQARLLHRGDLDQLDLPNLLEEIEDMGNAILRELESRIALIVEHLLKYQHSVNRDPALGWQRTLLEQRNRVARLLQKNPSVRRHVDETISVEYDHARKLALLSFEEYDLARLDGYRAMIPDTCPYTAEQILDEDWLPDPVAQET